jgi:hypothetical protein
VKRGFFMMAIGLSVQLEEPIGPEVDHDRRPPAR